MIIRSYYRFSIWSLCTWIMKERIAKADWDQALEWRIYEINVYEQRLHTWVIILCLRTFSLSRILMATFSFVSVFLANFTFANVPSPSVLPSSYLPTLVLEGRDDDICLPPPSNPLCKVYQMKPPSVIYLYRNIQVYSYESLTIFPKIVLFHLLYSKSKEISS